MYDSQEVAIALLHTFKAQQPKSGDIIPYSVLSELSLREGWSGDRVMAAIEYGIEREWFDPFRAFVTLTDFGAKELEYLVCSGNLKASGERRDG